MRIYKNSLGITCIEPAEGCLLKKNGQTFKKAYLGKNDRAELYEEVKDEEYRPKDKPICIPDSSGPNSINITDECILISPNGKQFKLIVSDDGTLSTEKI